MILDTCYQDAGYTDDDVLTLPKAGAYGGTANSITVVVNGIENVSAMTVSLTGTTTVTQLNDIATYTSVAGGADGGAAGGAVDSSCSSRLLTAAV